MIKEEKFKTIDFIRQSIIYLDKMLENFPKKDLEISRKIKEESYEMLKLAYIANTTSDVEYKRKNIEEIIARIKLIDFLVNLSYDKKIINQAKYIKVGQRLDDIAKYATGWLNMIISLKNKDIQGMVDGWRFAAFV